MVLKGAAARKQKECKLKERKDRTLYVSFQNKNKLDKSRIKEILESGHSDIERVFLPRQKFIKFVYVLCKAESETPKVKKALHKLNNEELGPVYPKIPMEPKPRPALDEADKVKFKRVMNPTVLLLEWIPKELSTDNLEQAFPEAEKVDRFNPRRCYVYFKTADAAAKAKIRISKEKVCGNELTVTFKSSDKEQDEKDA